MRFGALAAEREADLDRYFVRSQSFRRLRDGQKTVALGNRGVGKTAIVRMLSSHAKRNGQLVIRLAPEDYSYDLLNEVTASEASGSWAKHGAYAAAWKYLLYVLAMKHMVRSDIGLKAGAAGRIYAYLRDHHAHIDKNPIGVLISYLKRLEGIKIGRFEASVRSRELQRLYRLEEIEVLLDDLDRLAQRKSVLILVDELDRGWDASEDACAFVSGLFQAAMAINQRGRGLRVILSLRQELYESIPELYDDAQKIRDLIEVIRWDEETLADLMAKRVANALHLDETTLTPRALWRHIFAATFDDGQTSTFAYIADRSLWRPREIIHFCELIREMAVDQGIEGPIDQRVIQRAEYVYSSDRMQDVAAEYKFQYPDLRLVFETFRGQAATFPRDALELHALRVTEGEFKVGDARAWTGGLEPEHLVGILWSVGFLRAQTAGGRDARQRRRNSFLGPHQVIAAPNLANISRFHVHPMFREALGMREGLQAV